MNQFISFMAGAGLGWLHFLWFQRVVDAMMSSQTKSVNRALVVVSGIGRYLFTFLAGFFLIQIANLDALSLGVGLIVSMAIFRAWQMRIFFSLEESQEKE